jgi:ADP-ribose pyrophosphatase YjhB (NUDIX family)
MAAGVLFRDTAGRVLLVEPSYKPDWEIPGGVVEADEAPWEAAAREVREEIGLDRPIGHLLVIDHLPASDGRPERLLHVYDGGLLDDTDVAGMICADGEVVSVGFYTLDEARKRVKLVLAERLTAALQAADQGVTAKCKEAAGWAKIPNLASFRFP